MASDTRAPVETGAAPDARPVQRLSVLGAGLAAGAALLGVAVNGSSALGLAGPPPPSVSAVIAVWVGVLGMVLAGFAIARRPKDSPTLALACATALLAGVATHPDWDSVRLMQWVMAAVAGAAAVLVLLPRTYQRLAVSLFVLYHFAGILSAITSPPPTPWLTAQLWSRVFRPHLEFCYVNNAYQFYSPQPGPANILWFCITGADGTSRWLKIPRRNEMLDPLAVEYYRRLSLTERPNQNVPTPLGPPAETMQLRATVAREFPPLPDLLLTMQFRAPNEHARQLLAGYARHLGRTYSPMRSVKIYLTQHRMLNQKEFADGKDPYDKDTYLPFFVGEFDGEGRLLNPYDPLLYWIVPIVKQPGGGVKNYVIDHAGSDPFEE
jgi:hypothetical protein